jgi:hypothetical protein
VDGVLLPGASFSGHAPYVSRRIDVVTPKFF